MAKISDFQIDPTKEREGVWVWFLDDIRLRIGRHKGVLFSARLAEIRVAEQYGKTRDSDRIEAELELSVKQGAAQYLLRDWENVLDDDGKEIPYSPTVALKFFTDPAFQELYDFVLHTARKRSLFRTTASAAGIYQRPADPVHEGVWIHWGEGIHVRIARDGNAQHARLLTSMLAECQASKGTIEPDDTRDIRKQACALAIVRDWHGLSRDDDPSVPEVFSPERALELFRTARLEPFYEWVVDQSKNPCNFH